MTPASRRMGVVVEMLEIHCVLTGTHPAPILIPSAPSAPSSEVMLSVPNQHSQLDRRAQTEPACKGLANPKNTLMDPVGPAGAPAGATALLKMLNIALRKAAGSTVGK
ncbi:hypothetical protein NDU88_004400 [Pleurodeles waltl]|uniref:Uncharacterized protein n=1 Tax=Pleurodeles waltl TaxID=8319 RepID=A0AAV7PFJ0_PLEWA|nr:hypothetical protein NDU88_004400 [Pleurodeles waltl]